MSPVYINNSNIDDDSETFKLYYIKISTKDGVFYKIGICAGSVKKRFSSEPSDTEIEVRKIFKHSSYDEADMHEQSLQKKYALKGDRPFVGRCGPLIYGGNTECYSHDVLGGEPPPPRYFVRLFHEPLSYFDLVAYPNPETDPRRPYFNLIGSAVYMYCVLGPDSARGPWVQVSRLSSSSAVVMATESCLWNVYQGDRPDMRGFTKWVAQCAISSDPRIVYFSERDKMTFLGKGFSPKIF